MCGLLYIDRNSSSPHLLFFLLFSSLSLDLRTSTALVLHSRTTALKVNMNEHGLKPRHHDRSVLFIAHPFDLVECDNNYNYRFVLNLSHDEIEWQCSVQKLSNSVTGCTELVLVGARNDNVSRLLTDSRIHESFARIQPTKARLMYINDDTGQGTRSQPHLLLMYSLFKYPPFEVVVNRIVDPALEILIRSLIVGQRPSSRTYTLTIELTTDVNDEKACQRLMDSIANSKQTDHKGVIDECLAEVGLSNVLVPYNIARTAHNRD